MTNRKMFNSSIVESDAFLDMSNEAQLLYFHLVMHGDIRGYVSCARGIINSLVGIDKSHLSELIAKRFVLDRGEGLYLIKHWYIHNDMPKLVKEDSCYATDLTNIWLGSNGAYTTKNTEKNAYETFKKKKPIVKENKGNENKVKEKKINENKDFIKLVSTDIETASTSTREEQENDNELF